MSETGIPTPTYSSFLSVTLRELYLLGVYGSPIEYYRAVKKFILFLPTEIKELIEPETKELDDAVIEVMRTTIDPAGKHYTRVRRTNTLNRVCRTLVDPLMSKITDLLDDRGYLERATATPRAKGDGRLRIE